MINTRQVLLPGTKETWVTVCSECECVILDHRKHEQVCHNVTREAQIVEELAVADPHWATRPLTLAVTDRRGYTYVIDGVEDDTRVSLSGLDAVDKAAVRVLLQQALREIDPPRITGVTGIITGQ